MLTDATIGSSVILLEWKKITGKATIEGQTACYWKLSNGQQVKKELGYYWKNYSKSERVEVEPWSEEIEARYQAHLESKRVAAVLSAQKSKLHDYIQYMSVGYLGKLSSDQIAKILAACQDEIGDISTPRIR